MRGRSGRSRRALRPAALLVAVLGAFASPGCDSAGATGLVVVVDTDYAVPEEMSFVHARVLGGDGEAGSSHGFALADTAGSNTVSVPFSFGVVPNGREEVVVVVEGRTAPDGRTLVRRRARTGFVEGQLLRLEMFLARRCETEADRCDEDETCTENGCESVAVDPQELEPVEPGDELPARDAAMDGSGGEGGDAGVDGSPGDARAVDAPLSDAAADASGDAAPATDGGDASDACVPCGAGETVSGGGGRFSVTLGADAGAGSCGGSGGSEAYLRLDLDAESDVFVSTHGNDVDTVLYVRSCGCGGGERACNDDHGGRSTSMLRQRLPAGTHQLVVDTKGAMSGTVDVDVYVSEPGPESERCGRPTWIEPGAASVSGDTCGWDHDYDLVTRDGTECPFVESGDVADRVYAFHLPAAATVTFDGCTAGTSFDSALYLRNVCTDGSTAAQVGCADDGCGGAPACDGSYRSSLTAELEPGLYYLIVDGYGGTDSSCPCGPFDLSITGI